MANKKHKEKEVVKRGMPGALDDVRDEHKKAGSPYGNTPKGDDEWLNEQMGTDNLRTIDTDLDAGRNPDSTR